ncbi:MAG: TrmH family RNA methyltransferase [Acidimicrobiales bacterium]
MPGKPTGRASRTKGNQGARRGQPAAGGLRQPSRSRNQGVGAERQPARKSRQQSAESRQPDTGRIQQPARSRMRQEYPMTGGQPAQVKRIRRSPRTATSAWSTSRSGTSTSRSGTSTSRSGTSTSRSGTSTSQPEAARPGRGTSQKRFARTGYPVARRTQRQAIAQTPRRAALNEQGIGGDQVEGRRSVLELLVSGRRKVHAVFMEEGLEPSLILEDIERLALRQHVRLIDLPPAKIEQEALSQSHQGVIARAAPLDLYTIYDLASGSSPGTGRRTGSQMRAASATPFLVLLDGITDPHNLGSILRSAECAGVTGIVLPRHRSARITAVATKAASGAIEYLDFSLAGGIPAALLELDKLGVASIGFDSSARTSLYDIAAHISDPVALVFGSEGKGLSDLTKRRCSVVASIPQYGSIDSLNVASAAAVGLFHVARLRSHMPARPD